MLPHSRKGTSEAGAATMHPDHLNLTPRPWLAIKLRYYLLKGKKVIRHRPALSKRFQRRIFFERKEEAKRSNTSNEKLKCASVQNGPGSNRVAGTRNDLSKLPMDSRTSPKHPAAPGRKPRSPERSTMLGYRHDSPLRQSFPKHGNVL